jgi:hypothetical protein
VAEHYRAERRRIDADRLFGAALDPGEQLGVRRREAVPNQLDFVGLLVAKRRDGGFGEPRRYADAQRAGDELQQRPAAGLVEGIEPHGQLARQFGLAERREGGDDVREGGGFSYSSPGGGGRRPKAVGWSVCGRTPPGRFAATLPLRGRDYRPHQRSGLGQVAYIVVGQCEQHFVGALGNQCADRACLGVAE